jgi:plastocyanin
MSNSSSKYAAIILIPIILVLGYFLLFSNNQNEDIDSNAIIIKEENIISINKDPVVDVNRAEPVVEPEVVVEEPVAEVVVEEPVAEVVVEEPVAEVVVEEPVAEPEPIVEPEVIEIQILEGKVEIIIENIEFIPNEIIIRVGTIVTWINKDNSDPLYPEHTVSIDMLEINSPEIIFGGGPNEEWSHTFVEIGEFSYHCTIHPWMTGKIIVVD